MQLSEFHFELPESLIAQQPLASRSASRLLVLGGAQVEHRRIQDLADLLRPGDHLVFNDTRVVPARLFGRKSSGGRVELLLERVLSESRLLVNLRSSKSPKPGSELIFGQTSLRVVGRRDDLFVLEVLLANNESVESFIESNGQIPLPPYINRQPDKNDTERYQTIFAREPGAVAAPTAGLHFDDELLQRLESSAITHSFVTLHVGAGTFQPVRVSDLQQHVMHAEQATVPASTVAAINRAKNTGGRIIAVGTTSVRALESASHSGTLQPYHGETRLFITPGSRFAVVDGIVTNFHLPESTLLMLVCAFSGVEQTLSAYAEAVAQRYRFFSYGDAMLAWPKQ